MRKNLNWQLLKAIEALSNAIVLRSEQTGAIPRTASNASMEYFILIFVLNLLQSQAKFCEKTKALFEMGEWNGSLKHMDSATIENKPVFASEGQVYVYENTFPGYTIR